MSPRGSRAGAWGVRPPGPEGRGVCEGHGAWRGSGCARCAALSPRLPEQRRARRRRGSPAGRCAPGARSAPPGGVRNTRRGLGGPAAGLGGAGGSRHLPVGQSDWPPAHPTWTPAWVTARSKPRLLRGPHGAPRPRPAQFIECPGRPSRPSLRKEGLVAAPLPPPRPPAPAPAGRPRRPASLAARSALSKGLFQVASPFGLQTGAWLS